MMKFLATLYRPINRLIPWHKLPARPCPHLSLRLWNLPALRHDLRERNLYDTSRLPARPQPPHYSPPVDRSGRELCNPFRPLDPVTPNHQRYRTADGSYNDLQCPSMGRLGSRYGRNFPFKHSFPQAGFEAGSPTPRKVSNELMLRDAFRPADSLNLLAAAWIQFQVHDWARHIADTRAGSVPLRVPLDANDNWPQPCLQPDGTNVMNVDRTLMDDTREQPPSPDLPPTFLADGTFWWDGSQIYGNDETRQRELRTGVVQGSPHWASAISQDGHLMLADDNGNLSSHGTRLPDTPNVQGLPPLSGIDFTGFMGGWWAGLSLLHTLFAREHNAICDELIRRYGWTDDERLFQTARLINAALMAKIHTVEWTPAILGMPVLKIGMDANWWGVFGERIHRMVGRISNSEALSGIPGSPRDHHGVPYALTEEFVSVYRLHPLIPDEYRFHSLTDPEYQPSLPMNGQERPIATFDQIQGRNTRAAINAIGMANAIYSFGLSHPGAITLRNYPHFLRNYQPPDQPDRILDVATIDILRDRERGVPRYNRFRELLRMPRIRSFEDLNARWADTIAEVYDNDIDNVDTMVGLLAEEFPEGFGFSDTAFRIFILMASRRLKSDRFFTTDYTPEIYTQAGLDWINDHGFESVLLRHYPSLGPAVRGLANPFQPWRTVHV